MYGTNTKPMTRRAEHRIQYLVDSVGGTRNAALLGLGGFGAVAIPTALIANARTPQPTGVTEDARVVVEDVQGGINFVGIGGMGLAALAAWGLLSDEGDGYPVSKVPTNFVLPARDGS